MIAKFEPIGFDGHYNPNLFQDFLILDFLDSKNKNCSYICDEREWYLRFLENDKFKDLYLQKLREISSLDLIEDFYEINKHKIDFYNDQFLSETSKKDRNLYKGLGLYIFDQNYLFERSDYIRTRLIEIKKKFAKNKPQSKNVFKVKDLLVKRN